MAGTGPATIGENLPEADSARFLSADHVDSTTNPEPYPDPDPEEVRAEVSVVPRVLGGSGGSSSGYVRPTPATDKLWAVAFLANVCTTILSALYFNNTATTTPQPDGYRRRLYGGGGDAGWVLLLIFLLVLVLAAWGVAHGALLLLVSCPNRVLQVAYQGAIVVWASLAIFALHTGWLHHATFCGVGFVLSLGYFLVRQRQGRIRFAAANLKVAALAIKSVPWTIGVGVLTSLVLALWVWISIVAATGSITAWWTATAADGTVYPASECWDHTDNRYAPPVISCWCGANKVSTGAFCEFGNQRWVLVCFWLLSAAWGIAVLRGVVAATVSGSVASWWFSARAGGGVGGAFSRSTRRSLGSLCKAAAVTTPLRMITWPERRFACLRRVPCRAQAAAGYGLPYAVCVIAVYGLSFSEAVGRVSELIWRRGTAAFADDAVAGIGLSFFAIGLLACYCVAMLVVSVSLSVNYLFAVMLIALFLVPVAVLLWTIIEVVLSSNKMVFFCFMEDPAALQTNHGSQGQTFEDLLEAWQRIQGQIESPGMPSGAPQPPQRIPQTEFAELVSARTEAAQAQVAGSHRTTGVRDARRRSGLA